MPSLVARVESHSATLAVVAGRAATSRAVLGRERPLRADGVDVHAVEWTPTQSSVNGRRVLLVHGLGANTLSWEPIGQPLAEALSAPVTAIDLVGFGRTRAPRRPASVAANRRLVTAVLEEVGPSIVVGNSMGGSIGIGIAARRPELVTSLVLVNPALPHPSPGFVDYVRHARFAPIMVPSIGEPFVRTRARLLGPERLVDLSLSASLHDPSRLDPDLRRRLIDLAAERFEYAEAARSYAEAAKTLLLYLNRGLSTDLATTNGCPILLVHGEHDRLVSPTAARAAAEHHTHIDLRVLDGVGHAPQMEDPERLVEVMTGWLDARMSPWQNRAPAPASSTSPSAASSPS
jgi:pimeloyl-ACP methyl ester carboxylesterase